MCNDNTSRGSMTPILQYGFMNLIHAALTLLQVPVSCLKNSYLNFLIFCYISKKKNLNHFQTDFFLSFLMF